MTETFGAFVMAFAPAAWAEAWAGLPPHVRAVLWGCLAVGGVIGLISVYGLAVVYAERKISAFIQARLGPMHVGPWGLLQTLADGIKLLAKEDTVPDAADAVLFRAAPYVVFGASLAAWTCVPFAPNLIPAAMNAGLLLVLAASSVTTFGILLSGWSSNNKWSLLGGFRSAAQIVSYEVPLGLSLLAAVVVAGSLDLRDVAAIQEGGLHRWLAVRNPFLLAAFVLYFVASLAETNRTPFDIPEAESELVAGFHTEFSGMRFSLFFLAEYANMLLVSMIASIAFLGGWDWGLGSIHALGAATGWWSLPAIASTPVWIAPFVVLGKAVLLVGVMMWIRWTVPRLRVDQLMDVCWKGMIPLATVALLGAAVWP